jgi:CheY-like chemotaxis protein
VRLQIRRQPAGPIDGVRVDHFRPGLVYEIDTQLANVFMAEGWAEPVADRDTADPGRPSPRRTAAVVLVVDDEATLRQLTTDVLSCNGYEVVQACHGKDGIAQLREHSPDLVILDLNMPVMDGWQFRAEQLGLPDRNLTAIPVLLLTAEDRSPEDQVAKLNAAGLIHKPFDPDQLLSAIQTALRDA